MARGHSRVVASLVCALLTVALATAAFGQTDLFSGGNPFDNIGGLDGQISSDPLGGGDKVDVTASFTAATADRPAMLFVTATMEDGWHIYSITQKPGGPLASRIKLEPSPNYRVAGDWGVTPAAEIHEVAAWKGLPVEEHHQSVTWYAPIEVAPGVDPAQLQIEGSLYAQACKELCLPPKDFTFAAALTAQPPVEIEAPVQASIGEYRVEKTHTLIQGSVERAAGGKLLLRLSATPDQGWHVYALENPDPLKIGKPALIEITDVRGVERVSLSADRPPLEKPAVDGKTTDRFYDNTVTWGTLFDVTGAPGETGKIAGLIGYQSCSESFCDTPQAARFDVEFPLETLQSKQAVQVRFTPAVYAEVEKLATARAAAFDAANLDLNDEGAGERPIWYFLAAGLLGGLILNLMPCVLPVVGLKILSFVEQAGHDRARVLSLNLWYSAGLLSVFMVLATLPVLWQMLYSEQFIWGQQFANQVFAITLAALVFAMALSLIGVWEIPIPGFVGSSKVNKLAAKEGPAGAFAKGAITTVLATPCSGPFLGTALGWALRQPPHLIYAVFAAVGLGMASPYLLIGAYPSAIRFLPKPGAWMETFKQVMGFILLGTVVYLFTLIHWTLLVPTLTLLVGIWAACWWIGRTPLTADFNRKATAWGSAVLFASLVGVLAFGKLDDVMISRFNDTVTQEITARTNAPVEEVESPYALPWQPFSIAKLQELADSNQTVIVDFTAKWCPNCITLKATVLNTEPIKEVVEQNNIVPLIADLDVSPDNRKMLNALKSASIPVLAIFPAGQPNKPIIFRDGYTSGMLLEALAQAGPSKRAAGEEAQTAKAKLESPVVAQGAGM